MAHDTHGTDTHDTQETEIVKTTTSYRSAFWFTIILSGLFIAAVNFVNIMSHNEEEGEHGATHTTEQVEPSMQPGLEQKTAPAVETPATETAAPPMDSAHAEGH